MKAFRSAFLLLAFWLGHHFHLGASDLGVLVHGDEGSLFQDEDGSLEVRHDSSTQNGKLVWMPNNGSPEVVWEFHESHSFPAKAYRNKDQIAVLVGRPIGTLSYYAFEKQKGNWVFSHHASYGSMNGAFSMEHGPVREIAITGMDEITDRYNDGKSITYTITDIPLVPDRPENQLRLVLSDGEPYKPKGAHIPGAVWDQPLEKILSDHQARLKAGSSGNAEPARSDSGKPQQPEKKPESDSSAARAKESESSQSSLLKSLGIGLAVLVVAFAAWQFTR